MAIDERGRDAVVRALASLAVATAERGGGEDEARLQFIQVLRAHGTTDPALVGRAAAAVAEHVPPEDEPADDAGLDPADDGGLDPAEARRVRRALGLPDPAEQLAAALRAREWLQRFAADLAR